MTDLNLLRSFLQAAECGTITMAARRLSQLEQELDAPLFERTRQGLQLTAQGRLV